MKNKVYYGEYSLAYWIELMLKGKISLPPYQRYYVWNEERLEKLVDSFRDNRFVPPITIGSFLRDNQQFDYIIDGQQRLTSLLLAYLQLFPNRDSWRSEQESSTFRDMVVDEEEESEIENVLDWQYTKLLEKGRTKDEIISKCGVAYKRIEVTLDEDILRNTYLGFSYIVPAAHDASSQQEYYAKVFRDVNVQGKALREQESRRSLYFLKEELTNYFEPDFLNGYAIQLKNNIRYRMDFVRYLALLSAYQKTNNANAVARGYWYRMEQFYEEYIYFVVQKNEDHRFSMHDPALLPGGFTSRMALLEESLATLQYSERYESIVQMDYFFFGLIYWVIFCEKQIRVDADHAIWSMITHRLNNLRNEDPRHFHIPTLMKYMRQRMKESIDIYKQFLDE